ncbi:MAG: hypothetical protein RLP44_29715 [Aggregatilineales bacterium]
MPLADELTTVQTKITARASDIDDLLALGQSSATTALLNDIKAKLNALQSDHTDILNEVNTFPAKINAKLGFDAQLDQVKIEQNYQILDALDACENPADFYTALACALLGGVDWLLENPTFTQALRNFLIAQIQAGVGTAFDGSGIMTDRLVEIYDAVEACEIDIDCLVLAVATFSELNTTVRQRVADEIQLTFDTRNLIFTLASETLEELYDLLNRMKAYWLDENGNLRQIEQTSFTATGNIVHPVQLMGWDLASYVRSVVAKNKQEWATGNPYINGRWDGYMMQYLPDYNIGATYLNLPSGIIAIDPFIPSTVSGMIDYLNLPVCEYEENGELTETSPSPCRDILANGTELPKTLAPDNLPYLPASIITMPNVGRESLASATKQLWDYIGIFQNIEALANWINANEHGVFAGSNPVDATARQRLLELIHFTYYRLTEPDPELRKVTFLSAWSVALFDQRTQGFIYDQRTYDFLNKIFAPAEPVFTFVNGLDWVNGTTVGYSQETIDQITSGADRTFGTTELNQFSSTERALFENPARQGELWYEYIGNSALNAGIYLMTPAQHGCAQAVRRGEKTVQDCINEL